MENYFENAGMSNWEMFKAGIIDFGDYLYFESVEDDEEYIQGDDFLMVLEWESLQDEMLYECRLADRFEEAWADFTI